MDLALLYPTHLALQKRQRSDVRETGVSRQDKGPIEGPPETLRTSQHYYIWGALNWAHSCRETPNESLIRPWTQKNIFPFPFRLNGM